LSIRGLDREADDAFDAAIAVFRQVTRINSGDTAAHIDLGNALAAKGDVDAAIAAYREAIRLDANEVVAYANLGRILDMRGEVDAAIAALRDAIRLKPNYAAAHHMLGVVLNDRKGDPDAAIVEYRKAIHLEPNHAATHNDLGIALEAKGEVDSAIAEYREAMRLRPDYAAARANLDDVLSGRRGASEDAIAEFRRAMWLKPDLAEAHICLGIARRHRGRFILARDSFERARETVFKDSGLGQVVDGFLRETERLAVLEGRLPAILRGDDRPQDDAERLDLARLCGSRGLYAASAHLYEEVIEARPDLVSDPKSSHRYNAACAAALAGSGRAKDDPPPDETARTRLRRQALSWLRADLAAWSRRLEGKPKAGLEVRQTLGLWKVDPDLAGLRDEADLARLPHDERPGCRALWSGVDVILEQAGSDGKSCEVLAPLDPAVDDVGR
jgi:Flp pilus assembly protein TadD